MVTVQTAPRSVKETGDDLDAPAGVEPIPDGRVRPLDPDPPFAVRRRLGPYSVLAVAILEEPGSSLVDVRQEAGSEDIMKRRHREIDREVPPATATRPSLTPSAASQRTRARYPRNPSGHFWTRP